MRCTRYAIANHQGHRGHAEGCGCIPTKSLQRRTLRSLPIAAAQSCVCASARAQGGTHRNFPLPVTHSCEQPIGSVPTSNQKHYVTVPMAMISGTLVSLSRIDRTNRKPKRHLGRPLLRTNSNTYSLGRQIRSKKLSLVRQNRSHRSQVDSRSAPDKGEIANEVPNRIVQRLEEIRCGFVASS